MYIWAVKCNSKILYKYLYNISRVVQPKCFHSDAREEPPPKYKVCGENKPTQYNLAATKCFVFGFTITCRVFLWKPSSARECHLNIITLLVNSWCSSHRVACWSVSWGLDTSIYSLHANLQDKGPKVLLSAQDQTMTNSEMWTGILWILLLWRLWRFVLGHVLCLSYTKFIWSCWVI